MKGEEIPAEQEVRIDLPVRAFIPVGWVGQESLRLEIYRRVSTAREHAELDQISEEIRDRFGPPPQEVETLFRIGSLRITCTSLGITEISTFRDQVRLRPVEMPDRLQLDLGKRRPGASYHRPTRTLNLEPEVMGGPDLPAWVERSALAALEDAAA
jgi:transcription-repair coupling factor (superfamily II helicase)